jgi:AcrR family transcriptional regulator
VKRKRTVLQPDHRRKQLLEAATWVFARKGYRNASISDIIARAGVARGTFYLYFKSKEQIFLAIVEGFYGQVRRALMNADPAPSIPAAGPQAFLQAGFRQWLQFFAANRDLAAVLLKEASSIDPRFEKGFAELRHVALSHFSARIQHLKTLGLVRQSISPNFVAHMQLGMFDELLEAFVLKNPNADLDALAKELANFEWKGIRPEMALSA